MDAILIHLQNHLTLFSLYKYINAYRKFYIHIFKMKKKKLQKQ